MDTSLRSIRLSGGYTLATWDAGTTAPTGQNQLRYEFRGPDGCILFQGADYGVSPMHAIDSDAALLGLLAFLTLKPGDTDREYFANYTAEQMDFCQSSDAESLSLLIYDFESARSECACSEWENLDGWTCNDDVRGNVTAFQVIDHGEDGSQYFPGCGTYGTDYEECVTGVGDTGAEALEDALESMAQSDARPSDFQVYIMHQHLTNPDKSAFESLDHSECNEDHDRDDWSHWVSIRYTVRKES